LRKAIFFLDEIEILRSQQEEPVHYIYLYQHHLDGNGLVTLSTIDNILPFESYYRYVADNILCKQAINDIQKKSFMETLRRAQADAFAENDVRILGKFPNPIGEWIITSTPFDIILSNTWQCSLCHGVSRLVTRCPITFCTVRAHPICALLEGWQFCRVIVDSINNGVSNRNEESESTTMAMNLSFVCNFHALKSKCKRQKKRTKRIV